MDIYFKIFDPSEIYFDMKIAIDLALFLFSSVPNPFTEGIRTGAFNLFSPPLI